MSRPPQPPALRDQLISIPLMAGGMFLFTWLASLRPGVWYSKALTVLAWACAVVGAATIVAVLERALFPGRRRR